MPGMNVGKANADVAELHQSLRYMLKKWGDSRQEHKIKPSPDSFKDCLSVVDAKLCEMQLWDEILLEITDRPGLCRGHPALITLLKALRSQIADLTSAIALMTSEAKKRASFDWTLDELAKKKALVKIQTSEALDKLQAQVHREALNAERWRSYVAKLQASMTATIDKVTFGTNPFPELASVEQIEPDSSFRESKQPIFPKLQNDSMFLDSSPSHSVVPKKSPLGEEILVTNLSNGDRIVSSLTSGSAYYCFEVSESAGLTFAITQAPAGDSSNFIQILMACGSIPTSLAHSYHIRTRHTKHGFLQLSPEQVASGTWYIKVTGMGIKMKKFSLEVRLTFGLKKEVLNQGKLLDDIVNEIESQKMLANRLNALENASAKTTQTIINTINSQNSCCEVALQTSLYRETKQPQLSAQKPTVVKSQLGYFTQLFSQPAPDAKSLRRSSLRATLRLLISIYVDRLNEKGTDVGHENFCQFVYRLYMKRCNIVKQAETMLAELLNVIKTRRWLHIPRIQMFGRLCGIISIANESPLDDDDVEFFMSVLGTIKRVVEGPSANHNHRLDNVDGQIILQRTAALQALDAIFVNDTATFKTNILKHALARTLELSKGKLRSGDIIDGDALIEVVHKQWKDEKIISDHYLTQLFRELDFDQTGWLDFARFVTAWTLITAVELAPSLTIRRPGYCSMDLINIYRQMMESSSYLQPNSTSTGTFTNESNRDFAISFESFLSVCHISGLMTKRYVESRIPTLSVVSQDPINDDGSKKSLQPVLGRTVSMGTISLQDGTNSFANNWTQLINDWKQVEQLIVHEINHIRNCKFLGHNEVWNYLNKFKSELRLRRDLGAALMSYRNLMDVIVRILNESPLMPYRSDKHADETKLSEEIQ